VTALPAGEPAQAVLVPHWLSAAQRADLAAAVRETLETLAVHPVVAVRLRDVLTELHVAAAREAVWPSSAARVRIVTGWGADVLPVRLSTAEVAGVLALPGLPEALRTALGGTAA
jgi:hypothetical protein